MCNFADDTTPYVCDDNLQVVLEKLEHHSDIAISWFECNYMKLNTDKCHLLVSGHRHEHMCIRVGQDKIWEDKEAKLLGITIYNDLKFDRHVSDICLKDTVTLKFTFFLKKIFFQKYIVFVIYYKFSKQKI